MARVTNLFMERRSRAGESSLVRRTGRSGEAVARTDPGDRKKKRQTAAEVTRFLGRLFRDPGSDVPSSVDFSLEAFRKYKDEWLFYRSLGHETESGAWVSPLDYEKAKEYPKEMIDVL